MKTAAILAVVLFAISGCTLKVKADPCVNPLDKCVPLPSNDTTNYWACKK